MTWIRGTPLQPLTPELPWRHWSPQDPLGSRKGQRRGFGIERFGPNPRGRRLDGLGLSFGALGRRPGNHSEAKAGAAGHSPVPRWAREAGRGAFLGLRPPPRPPRHRGPAGTSVPSQPILPVRHVSPGKDSSHTGLGSILLQGHLVSM